MPLQRPSALPALPVRSIYLRIQAVAVAVLPTPPGFVFPVVAGAMPTNRPGPAPAPVDSPTQRACASPEMVVRSMHTDPEIQDPAQPVSPIRPGCVFLGVDAVKSADLQGSEIDVNFQSTRLERTKLNLIVCCGGEVSLALMTNKLGVL